jgi:hypothetical protein
LKQKIKDPVASAPPGERANEKGSSGAGMTNLVRVSGAGDMSSELLYRLKAILREEH